MSTNDPDSTPKKTPVKLKLSSASTGKAESPESLFRDLKGRQPHIQHLWAHGR